MKGAFQTSREIFENPIWSDVVKFRIFFYIVGNAVFAEEGLRIGDMQIDRGQYLRSFRNLQKDLEYIDNKSVKQYSLSVLKRKIDQLVMENRLISKETELGTLFTVVNYALYQGFENYKNPTQNGKRTVKEQQKNGERTAEERQENNNNKDNKDKNVKKDKKDIIPKILFAEFVTLTQEEYDKLVSSHGEDKVKRMIDILDNYKGSKNKKYASDYRAILNWVVERVEEEAQRGGNKGSQLVTGGQAASGQHYQKNTTASGTNGQQITGSRDATGNGTKVQTGGTNSAPTKYDEFVRR